MSVLSPRTFALGLRAIIEKDRPLHDFHSRACYKIDVHGETPGAMQIGVGTGSIEDPPMSRASGRRWRLELGPFGDAYVVEREDFIPPGRSGHKLNDQICRGRRYVIGEVRKLTG